MMKSLRILTSVLVAASVFGSCAKELTDLPDITSGSETISFGMDGSFSAKVQTKATEVTSLNSFYATAVTGSAGNESQVWNSVQFSQIPGSSPATYTGDKFWPSSDPSYKFYGSNVALNFSAGGTYVNASNATDVVCAYLSSPTYNTKNTLTFEHIFARLSDVTISAKDGYTITGISLMLTPRTGGTYNLRLGAGQTDASGWSGVTTASPVNIAADEPGVKSNDLWLVPGGYEVTLSWTATKGNYTKTFSSVLQFVQLMRGKINSITAVLGGDAKDVQFAVLINEWDYDSPAIVIDKESWKPKAVITVSGRSKIKAGKSQTLTITGRLDYSGSAIVTINGVSYNSPPFIKGKTKVTINGLPAGKYSAQCKYLGDEKYFESDIVKYNFKVSQGGVPIS